MRKILTAVLLGLIFAVAAWGQTVTTPILEFGPKVHSSYTLTNNSIKPMRVKIEPLGILFHSGAVTSLPIEQVAAVQIKTMEFTIGPRQTYIVEFKAKCLQTPCVMQLNNVFSDQRPDGMNVLLRVPTIIYSCDRQKHCRKTILEAGGMMK